MFQLDRGDLDFGLYRIMNRKAAEIEAFLENDLLPQVQTALAENTAGKKAELEEELAEARGQARGLGVDPETTPMVRELQLKWGEARADAAAEADVYNHLANFFARYYAEGDFISQRRYSGGGRSAYLIPYDGEEVKLHWANQDQYYVKSPRITLPMSSPSGPVRKNVASALKLRRPTAKRTTSRKPVASSAVSCWRIVRARRRSNSTTVNWSSALSTGH